MAEPTRAVFLSYASQDAGAARRICEALRAAGIEVWFDQSALRGGDAWDAAIRRQIKTCALFIPVISKTTHSRDEGYFRLEWKLAIDRSHLMSGNRAFLVPVVIDETADGDEAVPERFREVQWTRLLVGETPAAFPERIARLLSPEEWHAAAEPHGAAPPTPAQPLTAATHAKTAKSWALPLTIGLVVAAMGMGYLVLDKLVLSKRPTPGIHAVPEVAVLPTQAATPDKSIAVLPFVDMSEKHDQEYFSDGLSEELIDLLAKNPDLRVPARTSSFYFKGKSEEIATIAQKLHVAHLLEGSVRRAGSRLRVTAQLIRADNGYHLWSETYDRDASDVFKVQDEISAAVVAALKARLLAPADASRRQTTNLDAHTQYLIGRELQSRGNWKVAPAAVDAFRRALTLDPRYAPAWAGLARSLDDASQDSSLSEQLALQREALAAADKAVEFGPDLPDGYVARGYLRAWVQWDFARAGEDYRRARALAPEDMDVLAGTISVLLPTGRLDEALAAAKQVVQADPLNSNRWRSLGGVQNYRGAYPAARTALLRSLDINPDQSNTAAVLVYTYVLEGKPALARPWLARSTAAAFRDQSAALVEHDLGHTDEAQRRLDAMITRDAEGAAYQIAEVYAWWGDKEAAFRWLDRAYAQRDGGLMISKVDLFLKKLHDDPRFPALLRKLNLSE